MPQAVVIFTGIVVFAQMLDVGLRYAPGSLRGLLAEPALLLRALCSVLVVVPLVVAALIWLLPLPPEVAMGLALLAAAPGAPLTTRRSEAAGADRAFTSALQLVLAAGAALSFPLVLWLMDGLLELAPGPFSPAKVAGQVAMVTFLPLALGWGIARVTPSGLKSYTAHLSTVARLLFFAFLLAVVLAVALMAELRQQLLIGAAGWAAVILMAGGALAAGHLLGGPQVARRAGLAIASVARNLGLSLYLAESSPETLVAVPTILTYALLAILLAMPYSRWVRARV
ncbi:hypothetical protein [Pseudoruegeria sp. SHC-113]|uniref:hypothetical protein n=1 Tax=Pseudoruegeria sp. SHC-113 TaxID=2855439 RepID=UPI0021BAFC41|nr:hypothetical protein [Pseudoruegeria sp. SHC-113]MCT8162127.1 hypothetical protein [Pseudoruegeria sp. SHC-113]